MNCYLIDDAQQDINYLIELIERVDNLKVVGYNLNALHGLDEITALNNVDIVFTDLRMYGLHGLELIKRLPKHIHAIVTTVNWQYKEDAADLKVSGYLLKPFDFPTFQNTVKKLKPQRKA